MAKAASPVPDGYHTITPEICCRGASEAIAFYKAAFGAEECARSLGPNGKVMHAQIKVGDSIVMLHDEMPEKNNPSPSTLGATPVSFFVYVKDVDDTWKRAIEAGAREKAPLVDTFWGDRCGKLVDPFGHEWRLATRKEDLTLEEIEARHKAHFARKP